MALQIIRKNIAHNCVFSLLGFFKICKNISRRQGNFELHKNLDAVVGSCKFKGRDELNLLSKLGMS